MTPYMNTGMLSYAPPKLRAEGKKQKLIYFFISLTYTKRVKKGVVNTQNYSTPTKKKIPSQGIVID